MRFLRVRMPPPLTILSISSHVAYGHVGNSAAVFPMQRLGSEVWPIHTVQFSNHPGYGGFRGEALPARQVDACVEGLADRGVLARCDAVLSGYAGTLETAQAMLRAVERVGQANRRAVYACDPVIGDTGSGIYVRADLAAFLRERAVPAADILTPNLFELGYLSGMDPVDTRRLRQAIDALHARGPKIILVTSVALDDTPPDAVDMVVSAPAGCWRVRTPRLPLTPNGAGDALAALFLVRWLETADVAAALSMAASSLYCVLAHTAETNQREIALIAAQDELVAPTRSFPAELLPASTAADA